MATRKKKGPTIFSATGREETVETMKKELEDEQKAKVTAFLGKEKIIFFLKYAVLVVWSMFHCWQLFLHFLKM